jgi:hypothetical protein
VIVTNVGDCDETLSITASANSTTIGNQTIISLPNGSSTTLAFAWNTTGFDYGNYCIRAVADTLTRDDSGSGCFAVVSIPGDVDGNFAVQLNDLVTLARAL